MQRNANYTAREGTGERNPRWRRFRAAQADTSQRLGIPMEAYRSSIGSQLSPAKSPVCRTVLSGATGFCMLCALTTHSRSCCLRALGLPCPHSSWALGLVLAELAFLSVISEGACFLLSTRPCYLPLISIAVWEGRASGLGAEVLISEGVTEFTEALSWSWLGRVWEDSVKDRSLPCC